MAITTYVYPPAGNLTLADHATETTQLLNKTALQLLDDAVSTTGSAVPAKGYQVTGTDGTNARALKTDSSGELQIDVLSSALPSGAATETTLDAVKTSVETIDDGMFSSGASVGATPKAMLMGASSGVNVRFVRSDSSGNLYSLAMGTDGGTNRQLLTDANGELQVDVLSSALPSGASTEATLGSVKTAVELIDDGVATTGSAVPAKGMQVTGTDGTNARALKTDTDGELQVDAKQSGTWTVQPGNTANTTAWLTTQAGRSVVARLRNDYSSVNVTTSAYVQLTASTASAITKLEIFDSSGSVLVLATGAAASEIDLLYIMPGGNGMVEVTVAASTRLSIKAIDTNATSGQIVINCYS